MHLPAGVSIVDVGLRDGLQMVDYVVPVEVKLRLLDALHAGGSARWRSRRSSPPKRSPSSRTRPRWRAALTLPGLQVRDLITAGLPSHTLSVYLS